MRAKKIYILKSKQSNFYLITLNKLNLIIPHNIKLLYIYIGLHIKL